MSLERSVPISSRARGEGALDARHLGCLEDRSPQCSLTHAGSASQSTW